MAALQGYDRTLQGYDHTLQGYDRTLPPGPSLRSDASPLLLLNTHTHALLELTAGLPQVLLHRHVDMAQPSGERIEGIEQGLHDSDAPHINRSRE